MIKIGFCGSHSAGKTTLARRLHKDMPDSYLVSEVARKYAPEDLKECKTQQKILADQIREEVYASMQADVVITDRTVIDNAAYLVSVCGLNQEYELLPLLHNWTGTYDVIFFCPIENIPIVSDGFRFTDNLGRVLTELRIKKYIGILQRKHKGLFVCLSGDEDERYEKVKEVVGDLCGI